MKRKPSSSSRDIPTIGQIIDFVVCEIQSRKQAHTGATEFFHGKERVTFSSIADAKASAKANVEEWLLTKPQTTGDKPDIMHWGYEAFELWECCKIAKASSDEAQWSKSLPIEKRFLLGSILQRITGEAKTGYRFHSPQRLNSKHRKTMASRNGVSVTCLTISDIVSAIASYELYLRKASDSTLQKFALASKDAAVTARILTVYPNAEAEFGIWKNSAQSKEENSVVRGWQYRVCELWASLQMVEQMGGDDLLRWTSSRHVSETFLLAALSKGLACNSRFQSIVASNPLKF